MTATALIGWHSGAWYCPALLAAAAMVLPVANRAMDRHLNTSTAPTTEDPHG